MQSDILLQGVNLQVGWKVYNLILCIIADFIIFFFFIIAGAQC